MSVSTNTGVANEPMGTQASREDSGTLFDSVRQSKSYKELKVTTQPPEPSKSDDSYMAHANLIELVLATVLIVGGIWLYRRRGREDSRHGSQGAVLLLVVGAIIAIRGSGLLEYHREGIFG